MLFLPESGVDSSHTHSCAFLTFSLHSIRYSDCILHMLHGIAYLCILTHSCKLHSGMMHLLAFIRIFNVALQCIWYKVHSCAFSCILCRMHSHSLLHSRAFNAQDAFMCILGMLHSLHVAF